MCHIRGMAAAAMPTPQPQVKEYLESNSLLTIKKDCGSIDYCRSRISAREE
ncbi:MAG: hypothetical protein Q3985_07215 [Eubacteriales bacterium]|nr:hypothetical protein [Eubacteriales bacterium]